MPDDDTGANRAVTLLELKLLSQETNHKIDALTEKLSTLVASHGEIRVQVTTNTSEIGKLRTHYHDLTQIMTTVKGRSDILSTDMRRELARILPEIQEVLAMLKRRHVTDLPSVDELEWLQAATRDIELDSLKAIASGAKRQQQRTVRWFGMSREVAVVTIAGIFVLLNSPLAHDLWIALSGR